MTSTATGLWTLLELPESAAAPAPLGEPLGCAVPHSLLGKPPNTRFPTASLENAPQNALRVSHSDTQALLPLTINTS